MIKVIDTGSPGAVPTFDLMAPASPPVPPVITSAFRAAAASSEVPVLSLHWEFGDGSSGEGTEVSHTYTHSGEYLLTITSTGLNSVTARMSAKVSISGEIRTLFDPAQIQRPH